MVHKGRFAKGGPSLTDGAHGPVLYIIEKYKTVNCHMQASEGANRIRGNGILVPLEIKNFEFFTSQIGRSQLSAWSRILKLLPLTARQ